MRGIGVGDEIHEEELDSVDAGMWYGQGDGVFRRLIDLFKDTIYFKQDNLEFYNYHKVETTL